MKLPTSCHQGAPATLTPKTTAAPNKRKTDRHPVVMMICLMPGLVVGRVKLLQLLNRRKEQELRRAGGEENVGRPLVENARI